MTTHVAETVEERVFVPLPIRPGVEVPVALFAGGATGLLGFDVTGRDFGRWWRVAAVAEQEGLSSLLFGSRLRKPAVEAVSAARELLQRLAVERIVLAGAGSDADLLIRLAASSSYSALVLVSPSLSNERRALEQMADVRIPKLVLVGSEDGRGSTTAERLYQAAVGPFVLRHFPVADRGSDLLAGEWAGLVVEAIVDFVVYSCGNGGAIASGSR